MFNYLKDAPVLQMHTSFFLNHYASFHDLSISGTLHVFLRLFYNSDQEESFEENKDDTTPVLAEEMYYNPDVIMT
jgi:hypothetical protein